MNVFQTHAGIVSTLHEVWARKYSGALKQDLRYSPSKCFDTFPFPEGLRKSCAVCLPSITNAPWPKLPHQFTRSMAKGAKRRLTTVLLSFFDRSHIFVKIYDAMQHAIDRGKPYQTLLAPPPTDPGVTHPPRGKDGSSL